MAIVKMKRLTLLAMRQDREALLQSFQEMGCVEVDEPNPEGMGETTGALLRQMQEMEQSGQLTRPQSDGLLQAQVDKQDAERALAVLKRFGMKGRGLFSPRPQVTQAALFSPEAQARGKEAVTQVLEADRELARMQADAARLEGLRASLTPWLSLDVPLDSRSTQDMEVQFGSLTAATPFEEVQRAVEAVSSLFELVEASCDRDLRYCLLVCHVSDKDSILETLRQFNWSKLTMSGWNGTARENQARLDQELQGLALEQKAQEEKLTALVARAEDIRQASDRASIRINREEGRSHLLDTKETFLLQGWVPQEKWEALRKKLEEYPCAYEVTDPDPDDYARVPVRLKNNWLTKPLNMVTEMYSLPAYGGVDPNPLMTPFFILFYGIMMADMGYGLLMMLASVYVLKHARPKAGMHNFFALLGLCGVSTFIMGAITGGFFGDMIPQMLKLINPDSTFVWFWPPLFTPLEDTLMILVGAMALGFVQIVVGMAVSFVRKIQDGHVLDAVFEELTWWIVFAGIGLMVLNVTSLVLYAGIALVVIGPIITGTGAGKITGIFGSLYNHVTGYFGDILSYSRLMALMLAGSVIAQVFNTLGAIPGNIVIFFVISLAGNALNFALNLLGCYVHDLRLQCLEYFGKFYEDGGKPFRPMEMATNYYDIVES